MDNLCRVCRKTGENNQLNSMMISGLLEIYSFCTNIPIMEDSEKFYKICEHCMELLIRFNEFKKVCIESDSYFKQNIFVEIKVELSNDPLQTLKGQTFSEDDSVKDLKDNFDDNDHFDDNNSTVSDKNPHSSDSKYQCDICLKQFVYASGLKKHKCNQSNKDVKDELEVKVKKSPKKYVCSFCSKEFFKIQPYTNHLRVHTGEKPYNCLYCDKNYTSAVSLRIHTEKVHTKRTEYLCPTCPKIYYTREDLRRHVKTHSKSFECNLCDKKFYAKSNMLKHVQSHCNIECNICNETFANKIDYKNHTVIHFQDNLYKCTICDTNFTYLKSFKHHVKTDHPEKQNEDCIDDPQRLISENIVNDSIPGGEHKLKPETEKNFICNICGERLVSKYSLEAHITIHTGEKPFACDQCEWKFRRIGQLTLHKQRKHEKMPRFNCPLCSYRTYTSHRLKKHAMTHNDDKSFICDVCDATFKMAKSLKVHKRSHTGEKPYHCTYCSKEFASLSYLTQHLSVHTGEKRYTCKICDKKFSQRTPLVKHMESHKNESKPTKSKPNTKHCLVKDIDAFSFGILK